jgi:putative membrane protein
MNIRAKDFFSRSEKEKIRQAVQTAEQGTTGEIAVMVVDQSDPYWDAEVMGAFCVSGLAAFLLSLLLHHITIWFYVPAVFVLFFPCRLLFARVPQLKLPLVSRERAAHTVRARAIQAFYEKGLHKTVNETGILIFISLLERRVWILGDKGIDAKITPAFWQSLAEELTTGIRQGCAIEALSAVIARCGDELRKRFPGAPGDTNELPDGIIH